MIPYAKYPGLSPLFLDFLSGLPDIYPDPPTIDAAAERGRRLLVSGRRVRVPESAFHFRGAESARLARELVQGRAVGVGAGHQVGLFSGPVFTLVKALDAIHVARELTRRGVPAVAVFWALTDDHDLQEVARTARPTPEGPQVLVLEGADRQNRHPVGRLRIPDGVAEIVEAFRPDARGEEASAVLESFTRRSAPGTSYGDAFTETLLDLVDPDPLLVLDPLGPELRAASVELFLEAGRRHAALRETLRETEERLRRAGKPVPAPAPEGFSFFVIDAEGRRRVEDVQAESRRIQAGEASPSADVLTRPALKSYVFPMAASVLGAAEIAYHAQSLPIFPLLGIEPPVLLPRTHVVLRGPVERRLIRQLGIAEEDLLSLPANPSDGTVPEAAELRSLATSLEGRLESLATGLGELDASLVGALETARKKVAYQLEHLAGRAQKAAEGREDAAANRRVRLERALLPGGVPAERLYPPLPPMLAWGREVGDALRRAVGQSRPGAAGGPPAGAVVVDLGVAGEGGAHAG